MVTHVVLFRLRDRSREKVAEARQRLAGMDGRIDVLRDLEVGVDVVHSARSYDIALITRFDDLAGLEAYRTHPVHQPVLAYMHEVTESSVAVDFVS